MAVNEEAELLYPGGAGLTKVATDREIRLARALYQSQMLISSVYFNLGKEAMPVYDEMIARMRALTQDDGALCNYVGPLSDLAVTKARS